MTSILSNHTYMYIEDIQTKKTDAFNLSCQSNKYIALPLVEIHSYCTTAYDVSNLIQLYST